MLCPRRSEGPFRLPEEDNWLGDDSCSYCGSMNPDTLMARLEVEDVELVPTDKNYKVYVENKGGAKFKMFHSRSCPDDKCPVATCTHWKVDERNGTKFYFQHLSEEQRTRFIELHNDGKIKLGYPGHFYNPPFFTKRTP